MPEKKEWFCNIGYCDERECWVCFCQMNKLAIQKVR